MEDSVDEITKIKTMNLYEKLLCITSEIGKVNKNLLVGEGRSSYKAVGEADVLKAVKELEKKYRVYSFPFSREVIKDEVIEKEKKYNNEITVTTQNFIRLQIIYRFINVDDPKEFIDIFSYGDGIDSQDKAPGKAMTYADKYALLKAYKIVTGDDPDQKPSEEGKQKTVNKVTKTEAISIRNLMVRKGLDVEQQLKSNYKINSTEELSKEQYFSIMKAIANMPNKVVKEVD
jgi:hypothetical protein